MAELIQRAEPEEASKRLGREIGETVAGHDGGNRAADGIRDIASECRRAKRRTAYSRNDQGRYAGSRQLHESIDTQAQLQRALPRRRHQHNGAFGRPSRREPSGFVGRDSTNIIEQIVQKPHCAGESSRETPPGRVRARRVAREGKASARSGPPDKSVPSRAFRTTAHNVAVQHRIIQSSRKGGRVASLRSTRRQTEMRTPARNESRHRARMVACDAKPGSSLEPQLTAVFSRSSRSAAARASSVIVAPASMRAISSCRARRSISATPVETRSAPPVLEIR